MAYNAQKRWVSHVYHSTFEKNLEMSGSWDQLINIWERNVVPLLSGVQVSSSIGTNRTWYLQRCRLFNQALITLHPCTDFHTRIKPVFNAVLPETQWQWHSNTDYWQSPFFQICLQILWILWRLFDDLIFDRKWNIQSFHNFLFNSIQFNSVLFI